MAQPFLAEQSGTDEVTRLRREIAGLEQELRDAKDGEEMAKQASSDALQVIRALRESPLAQVHKVLKMLFGEISRVDAGEVTPPQVETTSRANSVWDKWIQKLGGNRGAILKSLLEHGEMTRVQLRVASQVPEGSLNGITSELYKMGLINRAGGKYSLKQL
jgi:hypothetical protein